MVDPFRGECKLPGTNNVQLPALRHGRRWIHGGGAISQYIQSKFTPASGWPGPALEADPRLRKMREERGDVKPLSVDRLDPELISLEPPHEIGTLFPLAIKVLYTPVKAWAKGESGRADEAMREFYSAMNWLEVSLVAHGGPFLYGMELSADDCALAPRMHRCLALPMSVLPSRAPCW